MQDIVSVDYLEEKSGLSNDVQGAKIELDFSISALSLQLFLWENVITL